MKIEENPIGFSVGQTMLVWNHENNKALRNKTLPRQTRLLVKENQPLKIITKEDKKFTILKLKDRLVKFKNSCSLLKDHPSELIIPLLQITI